MRNFDVHSRSPAKLHYYRGRCWQMVRQLGQYSNLVNAQIGMYGEVTKEFLSVCLPPSQ